MTALEIINLIGSIASVLSCTGIIICIIKYIKLIYKIKNIKSDQYLINITKEYKSNKNAVRKANNMFNKGLLKDINNALFNQIDFIDNNKE